MEDSIADEVHLVSLDLGGGLILWTFSVQGTIAQLQAQAASRRAVRSCRWQVSQP